MEATTVSGARLAGSGSGTVSGSGSLTGIGTASYFSGGGAAVRGVTTFGGRETCCTGS